MTELTEIIKGIENGDVRSKEALYHSFSAQMFSICLRYLKNKEDAEDVFQTSFLKVFEKIHQVKDRKRVAGWIRMIFVNECLQHLKKEQKFNLLFLENEENIQLSNLETVIDEINTQVILGEIQKLPTQYRTVFNLYVMEGYKHKEIAEELCISIGTSKSNLHDARKLLYKRLQNINKVKRQVI